MSQEDLNAQRLLVVLRSHRQKLTSMATTTSAVRGIRPFIAPIPGENGAKSDVLSEYTFALTGRFPEMKGAGRYDLNQGKEQIKQLIESFGGEIAAAVIGKNPPNTNS